MIATVELPKIPECHILDSDTNLEPGIYRDIARTSVVVVDAMKRKVMFEGGKLKTMWGCNKWYTKLPDGTTLTVSMDAGDVQCVVRPPEDGFHQVRIGMLVGKYLSSCGHVMIVNEAGNHTVIPTAKATEYKKMFRRLPDNATITIV